MISLSNALMKLDFQDLSSLETKLLLKNFMEAYTKALRMKHIREWEQDPNISIGELHDQIDQLEEENLKLAEQITTAKLQNKQISLESTIAIKF